MLKVIAGKMGHMCRGIIGGARPKSLRILRHILQSIGEVPLIVLHILRHIPKVLMITRQNLPIRE